MKGVAKSELFRELPSVDEFVRTAAGASLSGVHGITPWWLSINGNCQNDLEVGDVIEGLPDATVAIKTAGTTYHPQNAALLQWFEFQSPSTAIGGAYSYPDENVLTSLSASQRMKCR